MYSVTLLSRGSKPCNFSTVTFCHSRVLNRIYNRNYNNPLPRRSNILKMRNCINLTRIVAYWMNKFLIAEFVIPSRPGAFLFRKKFDCRDDLLGRQIFLENTIDGAVNRGGGMAVKDFLTRFKYLYKESSVWARELMKSVHFFYIF